MSLTGLVSLAESILNQTAAQDSQALATAAGAAGTGSLAAATANPGSSQDQFVPSAQTQTANATAEAAGLFRATQFSLFTAAAESLDGPTRTLASKHREHIDGSDEFCDAGGAAIERDGGGGDNGNRGHDKRATK